MDFGGKCCIVTGSAMGIGKAVAEGLLERGAKCLIADINWKANERIIDRKIDSWTFLRSKRSK